MSDIAELRTHVKAWERQFEARQGRKPTSSDARAEKTVWRLYQQYRSHKKALRSPSKRSPSKRSPAKQSPSKRSPLNKRSPRKNRRPPQSPEKNASDTEEDTPSKPAVTEIFPTPQLRGRALGLFDVELPNTPSRRQHASPRRTPTKTPTNTASALETPQSKKTPDYFLQRVDLFPADMDESPLIKHKRRGKSVSEFVKESLFAEHDMRDIEKDVDEQLEEMMVPEEPRLEMQKNIRNETEAPADAGIANSGPACEPASGASSVKSLEAKGFEQTEPQGLPLEKFVQEQITPEQAVPEETPFEQSILEEAAPETTSPEQATNDSPVEMPLSAPNFERRRKPKRQTKRVIMRPVGVEKQVSTAKPTENFVRLKINNKKPPPRRR